MQLQRLKTLLTEAAGVNALSDDHHRLGKAVDKQGYAKLLATMRPACVRSCVCVRVCMCVRPLADKIVSERFRQFLGFLTVLACRCPSGRQKFFLLLPYLGLRCGSKVMESTLKPTE